MLHHTRQGEFTQQPPLSGISAEMVVKLKLESSVAQTGDRQAAMVSCGDESAAALWMANNGTTAEMEPKQPPLSSDAQPGAAIPIRLNLKPEVY